MEIFGNWWPCDDGVIRPVLQAELLAADGQLVSERFLIDTGADGTVLSAAVLGRLQLPNQPAPVGMALQGISGTSPFVVVTTDLTLTRADGGLARIQGQFPAFTDPAASELSVLGRDVLDHFDLIVSKPRNQVLLLAGNHSYVVQHN